MDLSAIPYIATAIGAVVGIVNVAAAIRQHRTGRYYERSIRLLDLRDKLVELGAVKGPAASSNAAAAHDQLLGVYEREARANAALFVSTGAWLKKPGSYVWGIFSLVYGFVMALATGNIITQLAGEHPVAVLAAIAIPGIVTAVLTWTGARLLLRRQRARSLRQQIGEVDPVSVEGVMRSWEVAALSRLFSRLRRQFSTESTRTEARSRP